MIFVMFRRLVSERNQVNVHKQMGQVMSKQYESPMPIKKEPSVYPVLIHKEPFVYPAEARKQGIEGNVLVNMLINEKGIPENLWVKISSGNHMLDSAAVEYAKKMRFSPATKNGKPVSTSVIFPVKFVMKNTKE